MFFVGFEFKFNQWNYFSPVTAPGFKLNVFNPLSLQLYKLKSEEL